MKFRPIIAVVAGGLVWAFLFPVLVVVMTFFWPALNEAVQNYRNTRDFAVFGDTSMLTAFQILWALTNCTAGLATVLIARRTAEAWFLTIVLVAYFAYTHLWAHWDEFPAWYNLLVVVLVAPMVIVGGRIPQLAGIKRKPDQSVAVT